MTDTSDDIRVVHVDDDPDLLELTATFLEREDEAFSVATTGNASDTTDYLSANPVDCVVSDYEMPETDGIEFLQSVRAEYPDLPFILYTGKGSEEIASDAISAGVTDYLRKQTGTDHYSLLANRIRNAVERFRVERTATRVQSQFAAVVKHTADTILIVDGENVIRFVNPAVEDLFGYQPSELDGETLAKLMPDRLQGHHETGMARYLESGVRNLDWQAIELPGKHRDGHEIPLSISFGEFTQDGEPRFIAVVRERS